MQKKLRTSFTVDKRDSLGTTPLMEAARQGTYDRLIKCLDEGSDINAVDYAGNNALMYAIERKQDGIATILLSKGIDAGRKNAVGQTPLLNACMEGVPEIIQRLLEHDIALDVQDKHGNTGLMISCAIRDSWAACKLVDAGADVDTLRNSKGATGLDVARESLRGRDLELFLACVEKRREAKSAQDAVNAAKRQQEIEQNAHDATVARDNVILLKPVAFRPKPQ